MLHRSSLLRTATIVGTVAALGGLATVAGAQTNSNITATVAENLGAGRNITLVTDIALVDTGVLAMESPFSATITELGETGVASWSVTLGATDLTHSVSSATIASSNMTVSNRTTVGTNGLAAGVTASAPTGSEDLGSAITILSVSGQDTGSLYSGVYIAPSTVSLAVPNGSEAGAYTGTATVTLIE